MNRAPFNRFSLNRFIFAAFCFCAALLLPQHAQAQGYNGVMQPQQSYRPPAGTPAPSTQVDANGAPIDDNSSRIDQGYGTNDRSYDALLKATDPNNGKTSATELQEKIRQKREEMVRAVKANSEKMIEKQKQRAWEQNNPGKKYTGGGASNPDGYVDDGSANYQTGNEPAVDDGGGADVGPGGDGGDNAGTDADVGGGGEGDIGSGDADTGSDSGE